MKECVMNRDLLSNMGMSVALAALFACLVAALGLGALVTILAYSLGGAVVMTGLTSIDLLVSEVLASKA